MNSVCLGHGFVMTTKVPLKVHNNTFCEEMSRHFL